MSAAQFAAGGAAALRVHLRKQLPLPLLPAQVVPLAELPLSPGGKLLRRQLPAPPPLATQAAGAAEGTGADGGGGGGGGECGGAVLLTPTERAVAAAWEGALGVRGVGRRDHFFELGGSSVTAVRMLRLLGTTLQAEGVDGAAHGDAFERGNQRFATRLCGLYRRPRLRDYCVWLEWAALAAPNAAAEASAELASFSRPAAGGGRSAALLAAAAAALPEEAHERAEEAEALCTAAEAGGDEAVAALLRGGAVPDGLATRRDRGTAPLMLAAAAGEPHAAEPYLLAWALPTHTHAQQHTYTPTLSTRRGR